jgi:hypothetical protein
MRRLSIGLAMAVLLAVPSALADSEGLGTPDELERTVSLEGLTGISLFFTRAYQQNGWLYALYCTVTMAVLGVVIAFVTDFLLKAVGLEVHKIEHKE